MPISEAITLDMPRGLPATGGWLLRADDPAAPVALVVPALGVAARSYLRFGAALQAAGMNAACVDLRGVGSSALRARPGIDWGYLDLVDGEIAALYDWLRRTLPDAAPVLVGHSLGGQLALLHQARLAATQPARAIVLVASGSPYIRAFPWHSRWPVRGFVALTAAMCRRLGVFRGDWLRFGGVQPARLMSEWAAHARSGRFGRLGPERWDADSALAGTRVPMLGLPMAGDHYTSAASLRHLAAMSAGALDWMPFERIDGRVPGHFGWMRAAAPVAGRIADWWRGLASERR